MSELSAREILQRNAAMFEHRRRELQKLAQEDPYRHEPSKRTWWEWEEITRRENEQADDELACRRLLKAVLLSSSIEVCEALLRGDGVPVDRLETEHVARYGYR